MRIPESELILNEDGSIYHLHLKPGDISDTIITVGDQDRVDMVSQYFDRIDVAVQKREFKTHTGWYKDKRITVISTGIGTDNIDIVFNELDALVNIDFDTRSLKPIHTQLKFIRIGTSGAIQETIPVDSFLVSEKAIGLDNLVHFYKDDSFLDIPFAEAFMEHMQWNQKKSDPYCVSASDVLLQQFSREDFVYGITTTNVGFYGPQGRKLRLALQDPTMNKKLQLFQYEGNSITNLEMETSGMYAMAKLLGHHAISLNAILANRVTGVFSTKSNETIDNLIKKTLDLIVA